VYRSNCLIHGTKLTIEIRTEKHTNYNRMQAEIDTDKRINKKFKKKQENIHNSIRCQCFDAVGYATMKMIKNDKKMF